MNRRIAAIVVGIALLGASVPASSSTIGLGGWRTTAVPVAKGDITAIAALDGQRAWAVGYRLVSMTKVEAVGLRWNGTSWAQESVLPEGSFPHALELRSATDIWAVGDGVHHWDGKAWTSARFEPDPNGYFLPEALDSVPDGRAWVVGRAVADSIKDEMPVIHAWNGTGWQRQTLPDIGRAELTSVVAVAPDDVWAAGFTIARPDAPQVSVVLHWDGRTWQRVTVPGLRGRDTWISALTALAPDDVWAVGGSNSGSADQPFAMHWDGRRWQVADTSWMADGRLRAVARTGNGELWALGGKGAASVALRWNGVLQRWLPAPDPGVVVRGFATVPGSSELWAVGVAKKGDLVPVITRLSR